jgi:hypothetical protein
MFGKLMGWIVTLIGKLIGLAFLTLVVGVLALAGYFYYKSGQPMQVVAAQRIAPGITLREYMQYTWTVWKKADAKSVLAGNNGGCISVYGIFNPVAAFIFSPFQVNHYRAIRGTPAFAQYVEYLNGDPPPDDMLSAPWWKLPVAYWWQFEHSVWFITYLRGGDCRVRPLSPTAHSQPGQP